MSKPTLDEILLGLQPKYADSPVLTTIEWQRQQLTQIVADIIGEPSIYNEMCEHCHDWDHGRNDLMDEQRQRAKDLGIDLEAGDA